MPPRAAWLQKNKMDVTDAFLDYARPLIGETWVDVPIENGLQRFARFAPLFVHKRCAPYTPEAYGS